MDEKYILQMKGISKKYGDNAVLQNVSLNVKKGEIYALLGENGAGKSTLMNILFGMSVIQDTGGFEGQVIIDGEEVKFDSANEAMKAGIGMVHQEFMLIPGFTVTENIKIGREDTIPTLASYLLGKKLEKLDYINMENDAKKALSTIGMDINHLAKVEGMPVGYMQFIEIAREIDKKGIKLLVFDEPTAVLAESEADRLLEVMKTIAQKGISIIFITHRLDEVAKICDSMTVLRDGQVVTSKAIKDSNVVEMAELMVGRKIENLIDDNDKPVYSETTSSAIKLKDFHVNMPGEMVKGISLDIKEGEIFGIGGLAGQGKIGIPNGIMGIYESSGDVELFGKKIDVNVLGAALNSAVAFVSEDRKGVGLLLDSSIEHNIVFKAISVNEDYLIDYKITKILDRKKIRKHAVYMKDLFDIRCTSTQQTVGSLSGGNQQKVCLATALTLKPKLFIVSEPTRGIDIGAKKLILEYLVKLRKEENVTIIMVSSELVELRSICDRIAIVSDGIITGILKPDAADADFGLAMSAAKKVGEVG